MRERLALPKQSAFSLPAGHCHKKTAGSARRLVCQKRVWQQQHRRRRTCCSCAHWERASRVCRPGNSWFLFACVKLTWDMVLARSAPFIGRHVVVRLRAGRRQAAVVVPQDIAVEVTLQLSQIGYQVMMTSASCTDEKISRHVFADNCMHTSGVQPSMVVQISAAL